MENWIGQSGVIGVIGGHPGLGIMVKSIQVDYNTASPDSAYVTLSGSFGGAEKTFAAIRPVITDIQFALEEDVYVTSSDAGATEDINNIIINYIYYGDQTAYMQYDPTRIHRTPARNQW